MEDEDWDALRRDATTLMEWIGHDERQLRVKRRWLGRDWPETAVRYVDKYIFSDDNKCIAESFRRSDDFSDGQTLIHSVVETAVSHLEEKDEPPPLDIDDLEQLSDLEILEGLPLMTKALRYSELSALFSMLKQDEKKRKDRLWLERSILQKVGLRLGKNGGQGLENIANFLRNLKVSREMQGWSKEKFSESIQLPQFWNECDRVEAARSALSMLHDLPQRCLRAMLDHLSEKPYDRQELYVVKYGGSRKSVAERSAELGEHFLEEAMGTGSQRLPLPLQRALRVLSLYSREVLQGDNQLSEILDPLHPDAESLQTKTLAAIAQLQSIPFKELEMVYDILTQTKKHSIRHPRVYQESIRNILRGALYRCTPQTVPESVQEAVAIILATRPQMVKFSRLRDAAPDRKEAEVEVVLNLSSELMQMSWEWIENRMSAKQAEEDAASDDDLEDFDYSLCSAQLKSEDHPEENKGKRKINFEDDTELESIDKGIVEVGDETAVLAYVLVGRVMKEKLAGMVGSRATKYLRSGGEALGGSDSVPGSFGGHQSDPDMVLALVKDRLSLPENVMHNIEVRLEEFKKQYL